MANVDASTVAQQAVRLGLVAPEQIQDAWEEIGKDCKDPAVLLRLLERKGHVTPWQSQKLLKGEPDGYFLGGYRILYKIASGSFGRVYRADDPRTGTVVAVKVLRRKWSEDKHNVEFFEREGKLGMGLRHPNVVEILAVNHDPVTKQHYIVMEFVEGGNLREILTGRKKLEPAEALRILEDATAGLAYAFSRGLTHRDMKLTNVLISSQGVAKLVDFGLAGAGPHPALKTDDLQVDRTVDYAGLEKATNVPEGDVRSDIYFLGCVLYELLTSRGPLPATKDPPARMRRERFSQVPPLDPAEVGGHVAIIRLLRTMMSLNPSERFQTPSQLLEAIREVRRDLEGKGAGKADGGGRSRAGAHSVFVVEKDERLQDTLREKLKELGYRVFLAGDPVRALDRFRQQPYDALIVDGRTTGEDGVLLFERVVKEAERAHLRLAGILIAAEDQASARDLLTGHPGTSVLIGNPTMKQLKNKLEELLRNPDGGQESGASAG